MRLSIPSIPNFRFLVLVETSFNIIFGFTTFYKYDRARNAHFFAARVPKGSWQLGKLIASTHGDFTIKENVDSLPNRLVGKVAFS